LKSKRVIIMLSLCLVLALLVIPFASACSSSTSTSPSSSSTSASSSAQIKVIKGQSLFPVEDYGHIIMTQTIIPKLNEKLAAKGIKLELNGPDILVPSGEMFGALKQGSIGFTFSDFSFDSQYIPETIVAFSLPFSWTKLSDNLAFWDKYGALQFYRESYAKSNIHLTYGLPEGNNSLMLKKMITSVADLKGLKVWCSPPHDSYIAATGAEPVTLSPSEIFMGLQLGTLDGVTYSEPELKTLNFYQVVKYLYHPAIQSMLSVNFNFNLDTWKSFSSEVQAIIDSTVKELAPNFNDQYQAAATLGVDFFKSNGGTVVDVSPALDAQLKQLGRGTWDAIGTAGGDRTIQAIKIVRDTMAGEGIK
jgi:TRAP-type C4-dicarboxylate transport system substrate-binding protein